MKFIISVILTAALSYVCGVYELPWWSFAVVAFIIALLIHQKKGKAFFSGALALFLLWGGMALMIDNRNGHILASKMAHVFPLGGNYYLLIFLTAIIGALIAGLAALTGSMFRSIRN
jgi:hypothetical protein